MKNKDLKPKEEMSIRELHDWINWAESEVSEYQVFIFELKGELKKR